MRSMLQTRRRLAHRRSSESVRFEPVGVHA